MWRCICANEKPLASAGALSCQKTKGKYSAADLTEQLAQYEQQIVQLKDQILDKETQLHVRDEQLKLLEDLKVKLRENEEALLEKTQLVDVLEKKLDGNYRELALLENLKEKLRESEEALLERTQLVDVLEKKLDGKNRELAELVEDLSVIEMENEELKDKLLAEKHGMRTKVRNMTEKHEADFKKLNRKHRTQLRKIHEKHAEETSLKDQCCVQLNKDLQLLQSHACAPLAEQATCSLNDYTKQKIGELEEQVRLMTQEAEKSEARFITMEAQSKLKINQIEEELDNVQIVPSRQELLELKDIAVDLEEENEQLHLKVNWLQHVEAQNEDLQAKLEEYEEQHQNMQADLEQATKGQTSQTSESESAEELHSRLMKWRETVYQPTPSHDIDERNVMELRMRQLEEEREDLISELQELEEELGELQRRGQDQGWTKQTTAGQKLR
ncbi:interaptin-like, partial [Amblyraja radiata]|uniref:interaptin-like n=1 Tax=Amblyraja radiata TaxID=386614 RepID=UPI0014021826